MAIKGFKPKNENKMVTGSVAVSRMSVRNTAVTDIPLLDINPDQFRNLIMQKGDIVIWEKSMICPNRVGTSELDPQEHDVSCKLCDRTGRVYIDPKQTKMVVQGMNLQQSFYIQGRFEGGRATITSLPEDMITTWDKITMLTNKLRTSEIVQRREKTNIDVFKYTPHNVLAIMDKQGRQYKKDVDYVVSGNKLVWSKNATIRPADGDHVSVLYDRRPVYIILDLIKQHRDAVDTVEDEYNQMPVQATAVLDFLVRDEAAEMPAVREPDSPFDASRN